MYLLNRYSPSIESFVSLDFCINALCHLIIIIGFNSPRRRCQRETRTAGVHQMRLLRRHLLYHCYLCHSKTESDGQIDGRDIGASKNVVHPFSAPPLFLPGKAKRALSREKPVIFPPRFPSFLVFRIWGVLLLLFFFFLPSPVVLFFSFLFSQANEV